MSDEANQHVPEPLFLSESWFADRIAAGLAGKWKHVAKHRSWYFQDRDSGRWVEHSERDKLLKQAVVLNLRAAPFWRELSALPAAVRRRLFSYRLAGAIVETLKCDPRIAATWQELGLRPQRHRKNSRIPAPTAIVGEVPNVPVRVVRWRGGWSLIIDACPFCGWPHRHGGGTGDNWRTYLGHRRSHCADGGPQGDYILVAP